jgi:ornithine decarboxylase
MKAISLKNRPIGGHFKNRDLNRFADVTHSYPTPFMLLRTEIVRQKIVQLRQSLPGVEPFYAVKANNHSGILRTLIEENCAFDISSVNEIRTVLDCGVPTDRTIHSNPIKSIGEFDAAINLGVRIFVADNFSELEKFARFGKKAGVMLRFKTDQEGSVVNLSYKFGADLNDIPAMLDRIIELGLNFRGFCFHVGSQCTDISKYINAIKKAGDLIGIAADRGLDTEILDIGGGFPIRYTEDIPSLKSIGREITEALRREIDPSIRVVCEPGRFICGEAVTLFSSVIGKSTRDGIKWYYIDDGLYGSFSGRVFDQCSYQILTNRNTSWEKSVLAGPTCDSFDVIYKDCMMPPLDIGDILMFPAMGAYCSVSASGFNGLGPAKVVEIDW